MEIPKWYTEEEISNWLSRDGYPTQDNLPAFLAKHFQLAFEKGYQVAKADARCQNERNTHDTY